MTRYLQFLCMGCEKPAQELYSGLCDRCVEQSHWDYQESMVE